MKRNANKVLESIRQSLAQHLPSGGRAVLFGSQARGDALPGHKASDCVKCGKCESVCPQHLPIRQLLENVAKEFEKKEA